MDLGEIDAGRTGNYTFGEDGAAFIGHFGDQALQRSPPVGAQSMRDGIGKPVWCLLP